MRQIASMTVALPAAKEKLRLPPAIGHQIMQVAFGDIGQRPRIDMIATKRQFWCLGPNKTYIGSALKLDRVPVDNLIDHDMRAGFQG